MPYLADLGTQVEKASHSTLQAAINMGHDANKPYYVVPGHELQRVRLTALQAVVAFMRTLHHCDISWKTFK
jgi:hypothetical protein